jgi:hypothetical protein
MLRFVSVSRSPMAMCRSNIPAMQQLSLQIYPSSNEGLALREGVASHILFALV